MTTTHRNIERGTSVRFTEQLGAVKRGTVFTTDRFVGKVEPGQLGLYQEPIILDGDNNWHLIQFGEWDVAATETWFEIAN